MSVKISNAVWEHSKQNGNALVLLLKLADNAADDGFCWPGIAHLAERARMSTRTVIRTTKKLEADGEVFVCRNRRHGNKYIVRVGLSDAEFETSFKKHFPFLSPDDMCQIVTSEVTQPCHIRSDTAMSQESSLNRQEPSHVATATPAPAETFGNCERCGKSKDGDTKFCNDCWRIEEMEYSVGAFLATPAPANTETPVHPEYGGDRLLGAEAITEPLYCVCAELAALDSVEFDDGGAFCTTCGLYYSEGDSAIAKLIGLCPACLKPPTTTADMPRIHETCTCQSEAALVEAFGPKPEREERADPQHWREAALEPWANWGYGSDEFQRQLQQFGDSGRIVKELGYKLEEATGLKPLWGTPKKVKWWSTGLWELYEEAGYSIPVAIEAARALKSNKKMTVASPYSFVNTARALAADDNAPPAAPTGMAAGIVYA